VNDRLHPGEDRWLDLVNGLLDPPAREAALAHARDCTACADRLRAASATHERARARAGTRFAARDRRRAGLARGLALAAALVAVVGVTTLLQPPRRDARLAPALLPAPDASILTRDGADSLGAAAVRAGLEAYARGDFAAAERHLAEGVATGTLEPVRRLYLGNARLQRDDPAGALEALATVDRTRVPEPWLGELEWSLAVALAKSGRAASAESLRRVLADRDDAVGARARGERDPHPASP